MGYGLSNHNSSQSVSNFFLYQLDNEWLWSRHHFAQNNNPQNNVNKTENTTMKKYKGICYMLVFGFTPISREIRSRKTERNNRISRYAHPLSSSDNFESNTLSFSKTPGLSRSLLEIHNTAPRLGYLQERALSIFLEDRKV